MPFPTAQVDLLACSSTAYKLLYAQSWLQLTNHGHRLISEADMEGASVAVRPQASLVLNNWLQQSYDRFPYR